MSASCEGLYPIIRRVRRPLVSPEAVSAAPAVVPSKDVQAAGPEKLSKPEAKKNAATPVSDD